MVRNEFIANSTSVRDNVVSDYSNIGYDFIPYANINDVGKQWIRKYTLALTKELLGAIREKYSSVPIPGAEISLDGAALRAEALTEKEALITQLRENLEDLTRKNQFENRNNEANQHQEMLRKVPLAIYIG
jgi:C4-type Zn-finger protein